ncbi:MAG: hypothetical protein FGM57_01620 [Candidatus Taylorbacteria bacterium]|nr:hypothetical protein [Candidatus Taylorbacteria bacterium]
MIIQTWGDALGTTFTGFAPFAIQVLAYLFVALIIFTVGWVAGTFIGQVIEKAFKALRVDAVLKQAGIEDMLKKGGINLNSGAFVGGLIKWFVIAIFFLSALRVFGFTQVTAYLEDVVMGYIPHVIIAILILLVSVVIGEVVQKIVSSASTAAHMASAKLLGAIAKWAIIIFAALTALVELNIAAELVQVVFIGVVVALSIAFGLAFGLGGRDAASRIIEKAVNELSRKQ